MNCKAIIVREDGKEDHVDLYTPGDVMEYLPFRCATVVKYEGGRAPKVYEYSPHGLIGPHFLK